MKRRDLLKTTSVALGAMAMSPLLTEAKDTASIDQQTDVLVVGGGPAGTVAAIQAARAGATTTLLEMGSQLGGTTTTGGVAFPGLFHAWGRQVIAGIGWELVQKAVELGDGTMPDFSVPTGRQHWKHQIDLNPHLYAALVEEACLEDGVSLRFYQFPGKVEQTAEGWLVDVIGAGVRCRLACRQLIDCTGGADIVGMIGLARLREEETQPGTIRGSFGHYTIDNNVLHEHLQLAIAEGRMLPTDARQYVPGADSSTAETKTRANVEGRRVMLRKLRFLRSIPGGEKAAITEMMQETAIRETYRIVGQTTITHEDYISGRVFDDAVCHAFYPIDMHSSRGVQPKHLAEGTVATVSLGALIPRGSRNLAVAGRCVSSDRLANSALRVQASCMAMGQAVGAAAALAVRNNSTLADVSLDKLRGLLRQHGAIVPETKKAY